jgi:hypothetical protein
VKSSHSSVVSWDYFLFHTGELKRKIPSSNEQNQVEGIGE